MRSRIGTATAAVAAMVLLGCAGGQAWATMLISGVYDGPLPGGDPKGIELYVLSNIPDLSLYGLGLASNGGGTDGQEFTFPAVSASAGDFIYVANAADGDFTQWFGFPPDYVDPVANHNGDDAIELFYNLVKIDGFGDPDVDGSATAWDALDGWAYRLDGEGPTAVFDPNEWYFSGANAWDGDDDNVGTDDGTNATSTPPFPTGTYVPEPGGLALLGIGCALLCRRRRHDG